MKLQIQVFKSYLKQAFSSIHFALAGQKQCLILLQSDVKL